MAATESNNVRHRAPHGLCALDRAAAKRSLRIKHDRHAIDAIAKTAKDLGIDVEVERFGRAVAKHHMKPRWMRAAEAFVA